MRYPLADLVTASGLSEAALGRKVGLSGSSLKRAREMGLTEQAADRYATRAGLHPFEVWPEMADHIIEDCQRPCAECQEAFHPTRAGQVFCSKRCRQRKLQREWKRRRYQTDPAYAEAVRQSRREFYEQHRDYERARQRRYDRRQREAAA